MKYLGVVRVGVADYTFSVTPHLNMIVISMLNLQIFSPLLIYKFIIYLAK